jgi:hypothetical protein
MRNHPPLQLLYPGSPDYPKRLLDLRDPPSPLYICGDAALFGRPAIAVVGSRNASLQGLYIASELSKGLVEAGFLVVSGLARGIDGAAHRAALKSPLGKTSAICGTGLDRVYPLRTPCARTGHSPFWTTHIGISPWSGSTALSFPQAQPPDCRPCPRRSGRGGKQAIGVAHHRTPCSRTGPRGFCGAGLDPWGLLGRVPQPDSKRGQASPCLRGYSG